jgi:hypothetical protein
MKTFGSRVMRGWVASLAMLGASMAFVPLYASPSSASVEADSKALARLSPGGDASQADEGAVPSKSAAVRTSRQV